MSRMTKMELTTAAKNHKNLNSSELRRRRNERGLSQQQLAALLAYELKRLSLSQVYIAQVEQGDNPDVPIEVANALEKILPN